MRCCQGNINVARFTNWFSSIHCFYHRQFARFFLDDARNAEHVFRTFACRYLGPLAFVSIACRFHRFVHIRFIGFGNLDNFFFGGRIDRIKIFWFCRSNKFSVDEQIVFLFQLDMIRAFGRSGILPICFEIDLRFLFPV